MAETSLTQVEADALIAMEKYRVNEEISDFPKDGESVALSLQSVDRREQFLLDLSRGRIDLNKVKMQTADGRLSCSCGSISEGHRIASRTARRSRCPICMCTVKDTGTSGLCQYRWVASATLTMCGRLSGTSWSTATSHSRPGFSEGCSHD